MNSELLQRLEQRIEWLINRNRELEEGRRQLQMEVDTLKSERQRVGTELDRILEKLDQLDG